MVRRANRVIGQLRLGGEVHHVFVLEMKIYRC